MATFCDMAYTWDANKNKTSESITGGMSGYGFTSARTTYINEDLCFSSSLPPPASSLLIDIDANGTADVNFQYDALGRRVARTGTGGSVVYVQMDQQTIADYPVGGAATTPTFRYVYASYIDEPVVRKTACTGGTLVYFHRNHQYSVTAITTSTGTIAERYAYTAYGLPTILNASATIIATSAISNRYTYTGREWDATLALHHFRARWMSPIAGRFLGRDPIGYVDGKNVYMQYIGLANVDPDGLCMCGCEQSDTVIVKNNTTNATGVGNTPSNPKIGKCGDVFRTSTFVLAIPAPSPSYVAQHIIISYDTQACNGESIDSNSYEYWEAWPYSQQRGFHDNGTDIFELKRNTWRSCSKGYMRWVARYGLVRGTITDPPWKSPNPKVTQTKGPSTLNNPNVQYVSATGIQIFSISWDCCYISQLDIAWTLRLLKQSSYRFTYLTRICFVDLGGV